MRRITGVCLKRKVVLLLKKKIQPKQKTMVRSITSNLTKWQSLYILVWQKELKIYFISLSHVYNVVLSCTWILVCVDPGNNWRVAISHMTVQQWTLWCPLELVKAFLGMFTWTATTELPFSKEKKCAWHVRNDHSISAIFVKTRFMNKCIFFTQELCGWWLLLLFGVFLSLKNPRCAILKTL